MPIRAFSQLLDAARSKGPKTVAVAAGHQSEVMLAGLDAELAGLAEVILVGDGDRIRQIAEDEGFDISRMQVIHHPGSREASWQVMKLVSDGQADIAMKGRVETSDFLRAALSKEHGLRTGRLFTHVAVFEIPGFDRLIFISDAGVIVAPDLEQKVQIVQNAIDVAHHLEVDLPRVAVLAATEIVNPKIPTTLDAANLSKMADRGQIRGGLVDGPLALDNAISPESAQIKGIKSQVAGYADILIAPDIEAGNVLAKAITYFAQGKMAGVVVGGSCPLILPSRSDTGEQVDLPGPGCNASLMTGGRTRPEITIFAGRFGSGKTEVAINFALFLARGGGRAQNKHKRSPVRVILIDLDIVTPYFRSRETAGAMREQGVDVISPSIVGQHLDTPAITPQIRGAIQQPDHPAVLDVGGDQQGARALGQFSAAIRERGYTLHFVVNPYRPFTSTVQGLAKSISEIEASARLRVTDLVSNPNLIGETTAERITEGHAAIRGFSEQLGLPIAFVCLERRWAEALGTSHFAEPTLALDRFFVQPWE